MNILISNDDGIQAKGIQVLAGRLSQQHEVYVVAPDSNRSAVSHHISMYDVLKINQLAEKQWSCSGFPSDCIFVGLKSDLFDIKFDVVISGINEGANLGTDIVYSGTCGAARQAVLDGIPGIALSVDPDQWTEECRRNIKYEALADFTARNLEALIKLSDTGRQRLFVNVNAASRDSYLGVKYCSSLVVRDYGDRLKIFEKGGFKESHFIPGNKTPQYSKDSDAYAVSQGYIAVSRVYADPVANEMVDDIEFKL